MNPKETISSNNGETTSNTDWDNTNNTTPSNINNIPNPSQPVSQSPNQTIEQPSPQQIPQQMPQPIQDQSVAQPMVGNPNNTQNPKKKNWIIIGCTLGALAIITLIVALLTTLIKSGEKTIACTMNTTTMGVTVKSETIIKVKDGEISSGDLIVNVDLKNMNDSYKEYEKSIVDEMTEQYKKLCDDHCTFDYEYLEGDNVIYTMQYDKEGVDEIIWSYGTENMSAQEIANKVQETLEDSNTTCTQY